MAKDKWKNLKNAKFMKIADQEAAGEAAKEVSEAERGGRSRRRTVACTEISTRYLYRRAFSELSLLDNTPPCVTVIPTTSLRRAMLMRCHF